MRYKQVLLGMQAVLWTCVATTSFTGCGDDDSSFSPVAKSHSSDYTYTSAEDLSKTPCNEMRKGRGTQFDPQILDVFLDLAGKLRLLTGQE